MNLQGGILLKNTNYIFKKKNKIGYIFVPINNINKTYILFSNCISLKNIKDNIFVIVTITNIIYKKSISSNDNIDDNIILTFNKNVEDIFEVKLYSIIGSVYDLNNQINVLLYYNSNYSIKYLIKNNNDLLINNNIINEYEHYLKKTILNNEFETITIDPPNTLDIDDAISYIDDDNFIIHIADPNRFHEIYSLNSYYNNFTTIYLILKTYHLLPNLLSTNILSLIENNLRPVISIYFIFNNNIPLIKYIKRQNIIVNKNLSYNQADTFIESNNYNLKYLMNIAKKIQPFYYNNNKILKDTHDMIELFMLLTNHKIGEYLTKYKQTNILYRISCLDNYAYYSYNNNIHAQLNLTNYVHFTSPLRRTADFINHQEVLKILDYKFDDYKLENINYYNEYLNNIKIINNKAKYTYVASKIINGANYKCKLLKIDKLYFTWFIYEFDIKFTCELCKSEFIDKFTNYINHLKINEYYNITLFKIYITKYKIIKLMFELNESIFI
jgi:exoribonuclease R